VRADASAAYFDEVIARGDGPVIDRVARFIRESAEAQDRSDEVEQLRMRAVLTDPYLRAPYSGSSTTPHNSSPNNSRAELDLPPTTAGVRVIAAGVTGLFMAILDSAAQDPDHHDPVAISEAGLRVLRAALDALKSGT
jgi:hypothetical protein